MLTSRIVDAQNLSAADIGAWDSLLAEAHPEGNAFLSPWFARAAAQAYGRVRVCLIDRDGALDAVFPYQYETRVSEIFGAVLRVGEELNDHFGIIARPGFRISPNQLLRLAGINYIYFTHLHQSQEGHGLSGEKSVGGLRIELPDGGASYWTDLESIDPKFASDTLRRERQAVKAHGALRFTFEEPEKEKWLRVLLEMKNAQYERTGRGGWLSAKGRTELLQLLSSSQETNCAGVVSTLHFGNTLAAIHFGVKSRSMLHFWFPVYNPELSSVAPGRLLLRQVILQASEHGLSSIDRGVGETKAKSDFPSQRHVYQLGVWHRSNISAAIWKSKQSLSWRLDRLRAVWHK